MFATDDTIVAIATPPGRGALGVVRISGPLAHQITAALMTRRAALAPRHATLTRLRETIAADQVIVTSFPSPHSFTGQDVVEISAHGSPVVLRAIVHGAIAAGARLARPGEFTLRAFLNGRIDLAQAEAVADLIASATPLQARVAFDQLEGTLTTRIAEIDARLFDLIARLEASLDFPDEGYHFIEPSQIAAALDGVIATIDALLGDARRGRVIREGATVVVAGRPNVGKSSLFNKLSGFDRAIVTEVPGTTRDLLTEPCEIEGLAVTLVDTAGVREALDAVEREGVSRAARARDVADLVIVVVDASVPLTVGDAELLERTRWSPRIVVANKCDLPTVAVVPEALSTSAVTGEGLDLLRRHIGLTLTGDDSRHETAAISNLRHVTLLAEARAVITRARDASSSATPEEFLLSDLQHARIRFDEIVGTRTSDDVLRHIFERFCIGK